MFHVCVIQQGFPNSQSKLLSCHQSIIIRLDLAYETGAIEVLVEIDLDSNTLCN